MADLKRNVAVVIGINQYHGNIPPLQNAKADAEEMKRILSNKQDKYEVNLFIDEKATADEFWTCLEKIKSDMPDRLLIYFAGHGAPPDDKDRGHLLMRDASSADTKWVAMQDIVNYCNELMRGMSDQITPTDREDVKRLRHLLIILDCCHAGSFRFATRTIDYKPQEVSKESFKRYTETQAAQVIASSGHNEKAADFYQDRRGTGKSGHSPFAELLFNALEHDAADYTKDEVTTATEIGLYIRSELEKINLSQSCSTWSLPGYDQAEFFFLSQNFDEDKLANAIEINEENNPYRGLNSFDEAHHRFFFGRDKEIQALLEQIEKSADKGQPLTVVRGASGAGKSSLVKAGLLPKLRHERPNWRILEPVRLGSDPTASIARAILELEAKQPPNLQALNELDSLLRNALKKLPVNDKDKNKIKNLYYQIRVSAPLDKLKAVVCEYDTIRDLLNVDGDGKSTVRKLNPASLKELYLQGQKNSEILLDEKVVEKLEKKYNENHTDDIRSLIDRLKKGKERLKTDFDEWVRESQTIVSYLQKTFEENKDLKLLFVIDQFEELLACSTEQQKRFLRLILKLIKKLLEDQQLHQRVHLLLTIRSDLALYLGKPNHQLRKFWSQGIFNLGSVTPEQLRAVIELPALAQGIFLETDDENEAGDLIKVITKEVGFDTAGVLPLLSFTLSETFINFSSGYNKNYPDRTLKVEHFIRTGGVTQSITQKADDLFKRLSSEASGDKHNGLSAEKMLKNIMLRMVERDGVAYVKRKVFASELKFPTEEGENLKEYILSQLVDDRLILKDKARPIEGAADEAYYEPIHDCLITQWQKFRQWLNGDDQTEGSSAHRQQAEIPKTHKVEGQPRRLLSRFQLRRKGGIRLDFNLKLQRRLTEAANEWSIKKEKPQGPSTRNDQSSVLARIARATAFLPLQLRKDRHRHWLWDDDPALPNLALVASSGTDNWLNETESKFVKASLALKTFNARRNWALAFTVMAGLSLAAVVADYQRKEAQEALTKSLEAQHRQLLTQNPLRSVLYGLAAMSSLPNWYDLEAVSLAASLNRALSLNLQVGVIDTGQGFVRSLLKTKNGELITGGRDGTLRRWKVTGWNDGNPLVETINTGQGNLRGLVQLNNGLVVSGGENGTLRRWKEGKPIGQPISTGQGWVMSLLELKNGELISGGKNGTLRRWKDAKPIGQPISTGQGWVMSLLELKNGELISGGKNGTLRRWKDGKPIGQTISTGQGWVISLLELKNGELISGGKNGTLRRWKDGRPIGEPMSTGQEEVLSLVEVGNGEMISGGMNGTFRRWKDGMPFGEPILTFQGPVRSMVKLMNGELIISGMYGILGRWKDSKPLEEKIGAGQGAVWNLESLKNGELVSSGINGSLRRWKNGKAIGRPIAKCQGRLNNLLELKNCELIIGCDNGSLRRWKDDKTLGEPIVTGHGKVYGLVELMNGELMSSGEDGTLRRWKDGKAIGTPLATGQGAVLSLVRLRNGELISGSGKNDTIRRWRDGKPLGDPIPTGQGIINSLVELNNGDLVTGGFNGDLRYWRDGKPLSKLIPTGQDSLYSLLVLKNGELISGGRNGSLRRWKDRKPIGEPIITGQGGGVSDLAELKSGMLISGGMDDSLWGFLKPMDVIREACTKLHEHPVLISPQTPEEVAASQICVKYGFLKKDKSSGWGSAIRRLIGVKLRRPTG